MKRPWQFSAQFAVWASVAAFSLFFGIAARGQFGISNENIEFVTVPEFPKANENVTLTLDVLGIELGRSFVTWTVDGEVVKEGPGEKTITVNAGPLGRSRTVTVEIATLDGQTISRGIAIRPAEVMLVWEAETYTPPFYKGRAAYTYQSGVRAVALPEIYEDGGRKLSSEELVFYWKDGNKTLSAFSGVGKNSAIIKPAVPLKSAVIAVEVSALLDPNLAAETRIALLPLSPSVILYEDNPRYGVLYNRALNGASGILPIKERELTVRAEPFFFDVKTPSSANLSYLWLMNNSAVGDNAGLNSLTFRQTSDTAGLAAISVSIKHLEEIFQSARSGFSLSFGESAKTGR